MQTRQLLATALVGLSFAAWATPSLRIMPLGDSITRGDKSPDTAGYRGPLWTKLLAAGYNVDYVGTATDYPGTVSGMDVNHEGHSGWRLDTTDGGSGIYEKLPDWFASATDPHVILLHLGTNDAGSDKLNDMSRTTRLLDRIFAAQPDAHVIITTLMWRNSANAYARIQTYNAALPGIVSTQQGKGQKITLLDMHAAVGNDPVNFDADLLHPNATGYGVMADAWLGAIQALYPDPDNFETANAPAVVKTEVRAHSGAFILTLFFNQTVDAATAGNAANYTVDDATLGTPTVQFLSDSRSLRLTYSGDHRGKSFNLTVNGVKAGGNAKTVTNQPVAVIVPNATGAENLVPRSEFNQYRLVYELDIPKRLDHKGWDIQATPYSIDRSREVTKGGFSRVAYWLETKDTDGVHNWVWVSLDAFTDDVAKIGVPTRRTGAFFQEKVTNLRIWSNNETIARRNGQLVAEGNIEFWPYTYGKETKLGLPGGRGDSWDFDDTPTTAGDYGSMQIHDYVGGCTLFAFNHWAGGVVHSGVGNYSAADKRDWTESYPSYSSAKLRIYVMDDPADATPPTLLSAATRQGGTEVVLTFSKPVCAEQDFASAITLDGASVRSISRDAEDGAKVIVRLGGALAAEATVTATGVKDASPRRNAVAAPMTLPIAGTELPTEVTAHVSPAARAGYDLVYAFDLPVEGMFENVPSNQHLGFNVSRYLARLDYPKAFDRVGYYMELVTTGGQTNWVWTSCDAWTNDVGLIAIPSSAAASTASTAISNLDVESNVSGVTTGQGLSGGTVTLDYASSSENSTLRIMNGGNTVWAINNFRNYHSWAWYGLGVNTSGTGTADWRDMSDATVKNTRFRRLYVMVRPAAAPPASVTAYPAPAAIVAHVPEAANYALLQDVIINKTATNFHDSVNYAEHMAADNTAAFTGKAFRRVAYYLRYLEGGVEKWVWTSFDAPSQKLADIRMPDSPTQNFASRVANMSVRSNVDGVQTGDGIQTGLAQFYGCCPGSAPYLGVPNSTASYSTIDYSPNNGDNWGSFMVCNYAVPQFILSVHGLTYKKNGVAAGIGNNNLGGSNAPSWIFKYTVAQNTFTDVKLYVFVQEGPAHSSLPEYLYTIAETGGRRACVAFDAAVPDALFDPGAYSIYPADATVKSVSRSPVDSREVILTFSQPLTAGATYHMNTFASANGYGAEPRKSLNRKFVVPDETLPPVLNTSNVPELAGYEMTYLFHVPVNGVACGTYGAPYALDKTRFAKDSDFDRVAYALHLVGTDNSEQWVWTSMDAFTEDASKLGIPCDRRANTWQCYVDNLVVKHGSTGGTAPTLTDGSYERGNLEFFRGVSFTQGNAKGIPGANASVYDFGDTNAGTDSGGSFCSLQIHSYLAQQTVLAVNCLGGGAAWSTRNVDIGIGSRQATNPDWMWAANAGSYKTRDLYIFTRPTARAQTNVPVFTLQPQGGRVKLHEPLTLAAYAPNAVRYQWRKDGVPIDGATQSTYDVPTDQAAKPVYDVVAYDASGRRATSAAAALDISSGGTVLTFR